MARLRRRPQAPHSIRARWTWPAQWWEDWQVLRPILRGAPTFAWLRLVGRILDHPTPSYPGLVRTRVLIEELYAERAASTNAERWLDPHTSSLLTTAITRLPAPERALAQGELEVLMLHDRWVRRRRWVQRVTLLLRLVGVVLGFALVAAGFGWSGIVLVGIAGGVSYGLEAAASLSTYRAARRIWRAYVAQGGTPFW